MPETKIAFSGSIPEYYDRYLGPVLCEPYALDLAARLNPIESKAVLELACGTGIVTNRLRDRLPASARLVATDLNDAMLTFAASSVKSDEAIEWQRADACDLPFPDQSFNAVVCQFGLMFVPDQPKAFAETHRVLQPGGVFLFNVWDALEHNDFARIAHSTIATFFERDPPAFYKFPFGFHDQENIKSQLAAAGFSDIKLTIVKLPSISPAAADLAKGLINGNPVILELNERCPRDVEKIRAAVAEAVVSHYGDQPVRASMQALVCSARR